MSTTGDSYTHGYSGKFTEFLEARSIGAEGAFFAPHLRQGIRLLDCGCGPGSMTVGWAQLLAPGDVVGIDISEQHIALARERAAKQGVANVRFEHGNVYSLPFPDASFDAVYAHTMYQHLSEPVRALKEAWRVLKPGGVIGLRDEDDGSTVMYPETENLLRANELYAKSWRANGGDPHFGRKQLACLHQAGFVKGRGSASLFIAGTPDEAHAFAELLEPYWRDSTRVALQRGWLTQADSDQLAATFRHWGSAPGAFLSVTFCEAVAWKPS